MAQNLGTLGDVMRALDTVAADKPLIFSTDAGDIGPGYHVTEFKQMAISGIDCGGRIARWQESQLQLLDGQNGTHMSVAKFMDIARRSIAALPDLGSAPFSVEFAPGNSGLHRHLVAQLAEGAASVKLMLSGDSALCKPKAESASACCSSTKAQCC